MIQFDIEKEVIGTISKRKPNTSMYTNNLDVEENENKVNDIKEKKENNITYNSNNNLMPVNNNDKSKDIKHKKQNNNKQKQCLSVDSVTSGSVAVHALSMV